MYTNFRLLSIGATSDFGVKYTQNYMNNKTSEKINIKIEVRV